MSNLLNKIRSRGFWQVVIRPTEFKQDRVQDITNLYPMVRECAVQLRGWDFPHVDYRTEPHIALDWVGQELDWEHHVELWRIYQSGQFVYIGGLIHDWADQSHLMSVSNSTEFLSEGDSIYRYTEFFEFAARLALSNAGFSQMHIEVTISGIQDRLLRNDTSRWKPYDHHGQILINTFPFKIDLSREALVSQPREYALQAMIELFRRFNWDTQIEWLRGLQESLIRQ